MKKTIAVLMTWILILALSACSGSQVEVGSLGSDEQTSTNTTTEPVVASDTEALTETGAAQEVTNLATTEATATVAATSVPEALTQNSEPHEVDETEDVEGSTTVTIALNGNSIAVEGEGVTVDGSTATITAAGTYNLSGSLLDGQIIVNAEDQANVTLILNGVDLRNSTTAPLYIVSGDEVTIVLADGTENYLSDPTTYVYAAADQDEPNAALFSAADLTITGNGSLAVAGNFNDGIASQDGLIVAGGTISVSAVDDGIRGKDYLVVRNGTITVEAQGDGLKADNAEDATLGYISIASGSLTVTAAGDAIAAETDVMVAGGDLALTSGGGSGGQIDAEASAKGIKGTVSVIVDGGTVTINSADDAIHSNGSVTINGGTLSLASGDDGMHADATLTINDGDIGITNSYEGIESAVITLNGGAVHLVSSDDGVNVAGGNDGSGMGRGPGMRPGGGPGGATQETFAYTGEYYLYINGGSLVVDAAGDGLDANGAIEMTGGVVVVNGPTENMNGALDYDGGFNMTGGFLVAAGSAGMAQAPDGSSSQNSVLINFNTTQQAGTLVHIQNSAGENILTFAPTKNFQSIALSSPELVAGEAYTVYSGGSASGTVSDGWYQNGIYTEGTEYTSFTIANVVTMLGNTGRMR